MGGTLPIAVWPVVVVLVNPCWHSCPSLAFAGVEAFERPAVGQGALEALDFVVGLRPSPVSRTLKKPHIRHVWLSLPPFRGHGLYAVVHHCSKTVVAVAYGSGGVVITHGSVSYTHLRAHETDSYLVCRLLLEKKKKKK